MENELSYNKINKQNKMKTKLKKFFERLLCKHDYKLTPRAGYFQKEMEKENAKTPDVTSSMSLEHKCSKCGKMIMIGSGLILG